MYFDNLMYFKKKIFNINMEQLKELKFLFYVVYVEFEKVFNSFESINSCLRLIFKFRWIEKIWKEDQQKIN